MGPGPDHAGGVPRPVAALLLTGGASRRMGTDKARLEVGGEALAVRTARLLQAVAAPCLEVGPGVSGLPAVLETVPGSGPLVALAAGAEALTAAGPGRPALVVACDLPRLTTAALSLLAGWPGEGSVVPVLAGRDQPLCARWSAAALHQAVELARRGERALRTLLRRDDVERIDERALPAAVDAEAFADADTPAELARLQVAWRPGGTAGC